MNPGYCISATATYDGYSYLVVCMGSPYIDSEGNHIDYHGEMYDAATLFRWAFLNIENKTLVTDGELLGEVNLKYAWDKDRLQVLAQGNPHRNTAEQSGKRRHHHKARSARKREKRPSKRAITSVPPHSIITARSLPPLRSSPRKAWSAARSCRFCSRGRRCSPPRGLSLRPPFCWSWLPRMLSLPS